MSVAAAAGPQFGAMSLGNLQVGAPHPLFPGAVIEASPLPSPAQRARAGPQNYVEGMPFEYKHDFDENGLLFYIGTNQYQSPWQNPGLSGAVRVTSTPLAVSPPSAPAWALTGRSLVRCVTQPAEDCHFTIDLGKWHIRPTHYSLKHYVSYDSEALRDWKLLGSNDGKKWKPLMTHKRDESLNGKGATHTWLLPKIKKTYCMFRIQQTGLNSNNHWYCALSGFEVYGDLYTKKLTL